MRKSKALALFFLLLLLITAVAAPWIVRVSFEVQDANNILVSPNSTFWFGTDPLGRDLFSRVVYGGRISLGIAVFTTILALIMGGIYGGIAGFAGGRFDQVMMRFVDIFQAIPALVLMILVTVYFNSIRWLKDEEWHSIFSITAALSIGGWLGVARIVRGQVLQIREMPFVVSARGIGARPQEILMRHIFPHIVGPVLVILTAQIPAHISYESFLSFLGLGLHPPYSSWGVLAGEGWRTMRSSPHLIIFPGLVIFFTMMAFHFLGDGFRKTE